MARYTIVIVPFVACLLAGCIAEYNHGHNGVVDDSPQARMLFQLADEDNSTTLTHHELHLAFQSFDADGTTLWVEIDTMYEVANVIRNVVNCTGSGQSEVYKAIQISMDNINRPYRNGIVTSGEFLNKWTNENFGDMTQGLRLYLNLDVNKDVAIDEVNDLPYIFVFFDRNADQLISEGEFVIQWVKISL